MTKKQIELVIELAELEGKLTWLIVNNRKRDGINKRIEEIRKELMDTANG